MADIEHEVSRILKVKDADLGLFVLAMHSLMEKTLKEKYQSKDDFGILINRYTYDYYVQHGTPINDGSGKMELPKDDWNNYCILCDLYTNHFLSNDVRHWFSEISDEDAKSTVVCFLAFAKAENWTGILALKKLENEIRNWKEHDKFQSEELKRAIQQIKVLQQENSDLSAKANEYSNLKNQLEILEAEEKALLAKLKESEERLSKKDEKLDKIRADSNEKAKKFREEKNEILSKLSEYEKTQEYLSYLERVSFYTKTRHDYEKSIVNLTQEQSDALDQVDSDKDYLVKGAAGTGKSLVLVKALEKAVNSLKSELDFSEEKSVKDFRLLTYTRSLVKYNQYVTGLLETEVSKDSITTADAFLRILLNSVFHGKIVTFKYEEIPEWTFESDVFNSKQVWSEAVEFIWANRISKEQYLEKMCDREGMKTPLKKKDREEMWKAVEKAEEALAKGSIWPRNYAAKRLMEYLEEHPEVQENFSEYSFVDEAQDLPPVMLAVIKKTTKRGVFLAGDSDQSIYRKGFSWAKSGIEISGRTKIFKTNFRNTTEIHEYAEEYRDTFKNKDKTTTPKAFRPGPPVEHITGKNTKELDGMIVERVKLLMSALHYEAENICVIANTSKKLMSIHDLLDEKFGIESKQVSDTDFDFSEKSGVRLCTMQNCKGLDFPVVLFLADHRIPGSEESSAFDSDTYYTQQFNMVYVALTRAMEMLCVYTVEGTGFEPFKRLK